MQPRDGEILDALSVRVLFFSLPQIVRTWWPTSGSSRSALVAARARLGYLAQQGWLWRTSVLACPEILLTEPLFAWAPGDPDPPHKTFHRLAYHLENRFTASQQRTDVFLATEYAARVFGGCAGEVKPAAVDHDLHLATVYLHFRASRPEDAAAWESEKVLAPEREHQLLPDAGLRAPDGRLYAVIEMGGTYSADRLADIHSDCVSRGLRWEFY